MKFKFINEQIPLYEHEPITRLTYETDEVDCTEVLKEFTYFLKGAGFAEASIRDALVTLEEESCGWKLD